MSDAELTDAELLPVFERLRSLDALGIVILGRLCPRCGGLHDLHMFSTLEPAMVKEVLEAFADGAEDMERCRIGVTH